MGPKERERTPGAAYHHSGITVVMRKATEREREREKEREKEERKKEKETKSARTRRLQKGRRNTWAPKER